jgi:hypothetical protein
VTFRARRPLTNDVRDDLTLRLGDVGRRPIDPSVRHEHWRRISAVDASVSPEGAQPRRLVRFVPVAAAAVVGLLAGSTGLAFAGALPDPAQDVMHDVLEPFNVNVPEGKRGPCVSEAAKLDDKQAKQAAKDECPKGGKGAGDDETSGDDAPSPGRSGEAPGHAPDGATTKTTAPGRSGEAPGHNVSDAVTTDTSAPGRSGEAPGPNIGGDTNTTETTAPGRSGEAPGPNVGGDTNITHSSTPGRSGEAPGPNDDLPVVTAAGNAPGVPAQASDAASVVSARQNSQGRTSRSD